MRRGPPVRSVAAGDATFPGRSGSRAASSPSMQHPMTDLPPSRSLPWVHRVAHAIAFLAVVGLLVGAVWAELSRRLDLPRDADAAAPIATETTADVLLISGAQEVLVCRTKDDFDLVSQAASLGEAHGFADLRLSGRVFTVPHGTRARIISLVGMRQKVRILEGPQTGATGWVPLDWVGGIGAPAK